MIQRQSFNYQIVLILLGLIATILFGIFLYRELYPEYKIYQNAYVDLEKFYSSITKEPPPPFKEGVKQILIPSDIQGPPTIDRCTSCHVALEIEYFSKTKLAKDADGKIIKDENGYPKKVENEDYIFKKLDEKIASLKKGEREARYLESLKSASFDGHTYPMDKVLIMHPLIGKETRPFEFHPVEEYGCVLCHSGNGRALTTDKAHGPVFDGHYEEEFMGPEKIFLEQDELNDPLFAHAFNHKPGSKLLFQITPLLVGPLMQSKCIDCHQKETKNKAVDPLLKNYQKGKDLYISQGCYACHRISGFARGGVGPELTKIGNSYPWYIKQSIVWPQADLSTSTMPNYRLDHEELQDLMTFLLSQKGLNKSKSPVQYKTFLQEWEAGKRSEIEQPISSALIHDTRYGMIVFATEGCAACHRLKGFESNIGFSIEKEKENSFKTLYEEHQWFQNLFREDLSGSEIVKAVDENRIQIDRRISDKVRENSILEEIDKILGNGVESFYSNFKYALRAKDHEYQELIKTDPAQSEKWQGELKAWKKRVKDVLYVYIQEYGLGRLICPKPNWSGVYRSDEWLMEHFRNPSSHVPKSIMPVFPFDDTKFKALTFMLDELAQKNQKHDREIWTNLGFDPQKALEMYCTQCHGENLQGNGPVSEWIYPIPKNLNNAFFLRNLTKEKVIQAITHGVKGTPMAPWGETHEDKPFVEKDPILTKEEIEKIADFLFVSLPGGEVIKKSTDVPKWRYTHNDVLTEMKNEGSILEGNRDAKKGVDYFEKISKDGEELYYIKKEYYTDINIQKGREFFELNCAVCHGKEADGSGIRAEVMKDAKPRMLTNLDWMNSRDDLRLLQSIKYGVPGTSMTPWGDQTNALQRVQLVLFIRSLSENREKENELATHIYKAFDVPISYVEKASQKYDENAKQLNIDYQKIVQKQKEIKKEIENGSNISKDAVLLYEEELKLLNKISSNKSNLHYFVELIEELKKERKKYQEIGKEIIAKLELEPLFDLFIKRLSLLEGRFSFTENQLHYHVDEEVSGKTNALEEEMNKILEQHQTILEREQQTLENQYPTSERSTKLNAVNALIANNKKLKTRVMTLFNEAQNEQVREDELYKKIIGIKDDHVQ